MPYRNDPRADDYGRDDRRRDDRDRHHERPYGGWDPQQYGYGQPDADAGRSRGGWRGDPRDDERYRGSPDSGGWSPDPRDRGSEWELGRDRDWRRDDYRARFERERRDYGADRGGWQERPMAGAAGLGTGGFGTSHAGRMHRDEGMPWQDYGGRGAPHDRDLPRHHGGDDRGLWERTRSEVASWFGDEDDGSQRSRREDHRGRGPRGYRRSDERIREDVCDRLTEDAHLDASDVEVSVAGGEVVLAGTVDGRDARRRAEDCAERVAGVQHVQNNLRVRRPGLGAMIQPTGAGVTAGTVPASTGPLRGGETPNEGGRH